MHTRTLALLGVVCGLFLFGRAHAANTLTPQQISQLWVGKSLVGQTASGAQREGELYKAYFADGKLSVEVRAE